MNKSLQVASTVIAVLVGIAISRCAKYQSQFTRPVEMESIPAGYSYEGRFGQGRAGTYTPNLKVVMEM